MSQMVPLIFWTIVGAALAAYVLLAGVRRNVSLRPLRLGCFALAALGGQLVIGLLGCEVEAWQWWTTGIALAMMLASWPLRNSWLIAAPMQDLRTRIEQACGGLRLEWSETGKGNFQLSHKGLSRTLRIGRLGNRFSCLVVPIVQEKNKLSLLTDWLRKQFPGPVPRIKINLTKE